MSITVNSGRFGTPKTHHNGYLRVFRFNKAVEVWIGNHWISVGWKS